MRSSGNSKQANMVASQTQMSCVNTQTPNCKAGGKPSAARRLPAWLRVQPATQAVYGRVRGLVAGLGLHTVCTSARCPNLRDCWGRGTATFMICGDVCTRACKFCAVEHGRPQQLDPAEPARVAEAVHQLGLRYVVITSVTRDDLPDGGAAHFAATVRAIRERNPQTEVEVLVPDFGGRPECIRTVVNAGVRVFGHNLETVRRLTPAVRSAASYERSLLVLATARQLAPENVWTKSGLMLGFGETEQEVLEALMDLRRVGCDVVTLGQYLQPASDCLPVAEFIRPEQFDRYAAHARALGFKHVVSGPLVRSSYMAEAVLGRVPCP